MTYYRVENILGQLHMAVLFTNAEFAQANNLSTSPGRAINKYKADLYSEWLKKNHQLEEFRRSYFRNIKWVKNNDKI